MSNSVSILKQFFILGCLSFGGPAAHIGYFRQTFVERLKWLTDAEYAQIVALCQFLPGPASSQVGFALGYRRGGLLGALSAFVGFTTPSILLMLGLAIASSSLMGTTWFEGLMHGLKLLAVVVVADATLGMYRNFCTSKLAAALCVATAAALLTLPSLITQMLVLAVAAAIGQAYLKNNDQPQVASQGINWWPLLLFVVLFVSLPLLAKSGGLTALFGDFFQAGALVFGGGHVVLPLLQKLVGAQLSSDVFLTGYAAAQAVPGPMFTFATFLGYELAPQAPILGALLATAAVFLPGFLLILGLFNHWQALANSPRLSGAINGVNAAVVGLLLAALYQPVFVSAVLNATDMALVVVGIYLLKRQQWAILWLVLFFIVSGVGLSLLA
ncbi:chromate efflux transporter [Paraferrimonas sedimenticola]|uniref:Chorismate-binding protein n=1 Tax=Paraferrimonas sedimenticola TaxID=375674 RepID=A0AA37W056_9GAMM|nr:chromate efflux transporter [Paraferrimonas sedimenticola]GLP95008.1 chorismate-binding protein [Paraferrimonas sedimenticola]